jgi:hypothetical protein
MRYSFRYSPRSSYGYKGVGALTNDQLTVSVDHTHISSPKRNSRAKAPKYRPHPSKGQGRLVFLIACAGCLLEGPVPRNVDE